MVVLFMSSSSSSNTKNNIDNHQSCCITKSDNNKMKIKKKSVRFAKKVYAISSRQSSLPLSLLDRIDDHNDIDNDIMITSFSSTISTWYNSNDYKRFAAQHNMIAKLKVLTKNTIGKTTTKQNNSNDDNVGTANDSTTNNINNDINGISTTTTKGEEFHGILTPQDINNKKQIVKNAYRAVMREQYIQIQSNEHNVNCIAQKYIVHSTPSLQQAQEKAFKLQQDIQEYVMQQDFYSSWSDISLDGSDNDDDEQQPQTEQDKSSHSKKSKAKKLLNKSSLVRFGTNVRVSKKLFQKKVAAII